jgi:hypothetical protein
MSVPTTTAPPPANDAEDEEPLAKIHRSRRLTKRRPADTGEEEPLAGWADPVPLAKGGGCACSN